jgi:Tfp pilus assembly protein PilF
LLALWFTLACGHHEGTAQTKSQDNFGVQMARMNLWREAMFRFQRAVDINPANAVAHNNLAVAYEANGDFDKARKEYLEALKLDRNNAYIQKNYSRFVEFLSRNKKRQQAAAKTSPAAFTPTASGSSGATPVMAGQPPITAQPPSGVPNPPVKPSDLPQPAPPTPPSPVPPLT